MSGFIEKNRAFLAIRRQYDFSNRSAVASDERAQLADPHAAALMATKSVLSSREFERSVAALKEHNERRRIHVETLELEESLRKHGALSEAEIKTQCNDFYAAKLRQYMAKVAARATSAAAGASSGTTKRGREDDDGNKKGADRFATAFGVSERSRQPAQTDSGSSEQQTEEHGGHDGSAFDRDTTDAEKEKRVAQLQMERQQRIAESIQKKLNAEAARAQKTKEHAS